MKKDKETEDLFKKVEGMFYNYQKLKNKVKYIDEEIQFIKDDIIGCGSISYSERVQTSINTKSSVEMEVEKRQKQIEYLERQKSLKERDLKRIERAISNFNEDEKNMFDIRYLEKDKSWESYCDKFNICKDTYYAIRNNMIYKSMSIMYPLYNFKNTPMENLIS